MFIWWIYVTNDYNKWLQLLLYVFQNKSIDLCKKKGFYGEIFAGAEDAWVHTVK